MAGLLLQLFPFSREPNLDTEMTEIGRVFSMTRCQYKHCLATEVPEILSDEQKTKNSPLVNDRSLLVNPLTYSVQCVCSPLMATKPIIVTSNKLYKFSYATAHSHLTVYKTALHMNCNHSATHPILPQE